MAERSENYSNLIFDEKLRFALLASLRLVFF